MNVPCGLIQDLLPIYYDEVCSQESRSLVEEHLAECPACRQRLADLSAPLPTPEEEEETAALKEVQTTWKKARRRARWKGVAIALAAIFLAVCPLWLTIHKGTDIPTEDIQISQACQLEDGTVVFHFYIDDGKSLDTLLVEETDDGSVYFTPKRALLEPRRTSEYGLYNTYIAFSVTQDPEKVNPHASYNLGGDVPAVYVGTPKDRILIWEKGEDLPPASPAMETMMETQYIPFWETYRPSFDWEGYHQALESVLGDEMAGKEETT